MSPVEILHTGHFAYIFFFLWGCFRDHENTVESLFLPHRCFFFFRKNGRWWFLYCMIRAEIPHSLVLSVITCAPQWLVWSFCCCVVPVSCFVTALCLCAVMQRKVIQVNFFRFFLPCLQEHGCVEIQKFCYHGNVTQRLIISVDVQLILIIIAWRF